VITVKYADDKSIWKRKDIIDKQINISGMMPLADARFFGNLGETKQLIGWDYAHKN
jgi:hypothetical protein